MRSSLKKTKVSFTYFESFVRSRINSGTDSIMRLSHIYLAVSGIYIYIYIYKVLCMMFVLEKEHIPYAQG